VADATRYGRATPLLQLLLLLSPPVLLRLLLVGCCIAYLVISTAELVKTTVILFIRPVLLSLLLALHVIYSVL